MKRRSKRSANTPYQSVHGMIGKDVYNHQIDELGAIEDIVMDVQTGRIGFAVLRCHLPTAEGEKRVAVPWYKLHLDTQLHCFLLDLTIDRLLAAPALDACAATSDGLFLAPGAAHGLPSRSSRPPCV